MLYVFVAVNFARGLRKARSVNNRGVVELIRDQQVRIARHQGLADGYIGGETGLKQDGGFGVLELGEFFLQLFMYGHRADYGAYRCRAYTVLFDSQDSGLLY